MARPSANDSAWAAFCKSDAAPYTVWGVYIYVTVLFTVSQLRRGGCGLPMRGSLHTMDQRVPATMKQRRGLKEIVSTPESLKRPELLRADSPVLMLISSPTVQAE